MKTWISAQASAIGASHLKSNTPCQDSFYVKLTDDGNWMVIVVSDGAGTASRADEGSKFVSEFMGKELFELVNELGHRTPGHWINDFIIEKILEARENLRKLAGSDNISELNCTLVACLLGPEGGFSVHIGDGSIVGGYKEKTTFKHRYKLYQSLPENGEYANETFFITEGDWIKHLRISPIPALDWIICCSDGGASLALLDERNPKPGFLIPIIKDIFSKKDTALFSSSLATYLEDPQADTVTSDDKTLVIGCRPFVIKNATDYFQVLPETSKPVEEISQRRLSVIRNQLKESENPSQFPRSNLPSFLQKYRVALLVSGIPFILLSIGAIYLVQSVMTPVRETTPCTYDIPAEDSERPIGPSAPIATVDVQARGITLLEYGFLPGQTFLDVYGEPFDSDLLDRAIDIINQWNLKDLYDWDQLRGLARSLGEIGDDYENDTRQNCRFYFAYWSEDLSYTEDFREFVYANTRGISREDYLRLINNGL